ncbi:hypothetical protein H9Y04_32300 [Streptomyces sp. TRM66268-LWL]|uniref:Lipoprotein n=1 Tax=Streptomyces polyasparticus TaxID=2767826 RepID=A0ABR7SRB6_9ACTN|nr:hypothetical protein [Streptomyces polyasparticus]MBC9717220.1 hypothetical protein [Streptomyces polyasparticus]
MSTTRRRTLSAAGVTLCAGLLMGTLAACGDDAGGDSIADKSAKEISDAAQQSLLDAKSLRMAMSGGTGDDGPTAFDLHVDQDGNCSGTFEMGTGKGSFDILKRGDKVWIKADPQFWKATGGPQGEAVSKLLGDKYLVGDANDPQMSDLSSSCNLKELQKEMKSDDDSDDLKKGGKSSVDGQETITIEATDKGEKSTIDVATEGEPYPLKIVNNEDGKKETVLLSDYNKPVTSETPPAGETVDIKELQKQQS